MATDDKNATGSETKEAKKAEKSQPVLLINVWYDDEDGNHKFAKVGDPVPDSIIESLNSNYYKS